MFVCLRIGSDQSMYLNCKSVSLIYRTHVHTHIGIWVFIIEDSIMDLIHDCLDFVRSYK